jgi:hypothetical protein
VETRHPGDLASGIGYAVEEVPGTGQVDQPDQEGQEDRDSQGELDETLAALRPATSSILSRAQFVTVTVFVRVAGPAAFDATRVTV